MSVAFVIPQMMLAATVFIPNMGVPMLITSRVVNVMGREFAKHRIARADDDEIFLVGGHFDAAKDFERRVFFVQARQMFRRNELPMVGEYQCVEFGFDRGANLRFFRGSAARRPLARMNVEIDSQNIASRNLLEREYSIKPITWQTKPGYRAPVLSCL